MLGSKEHDILTEKRNQYEVENVGFKINVGLELEKVKCLYAESYGGER